MQPCLSSGVRPDGAQRSLPASTFPRVGGSSRSCLPACCAGTRAVATVSLGERPEWCFPELCPTLHPRPGAPLWAEGLALWLLEEGVHVTLPFLLSVRRDADFWRRHLEVCWYVLRTTMPTCTDLQHLTVVAAICSALLLKRLCAAPRASFLATHPLPLQCPFSRLLFPPRPA